MTLRALHFATALIALACASAAPPPRLPAAARILLPGSDGRTHDVIAEVAQEKLTVFVFYSRTCPCLRVHEPRLRSIRDDYQGRGVAVVLVNSEVNADAARDSLEAHTRGYTFPLLTDAGANLAKSVHAEFATHAIVVDSGGRILYSGGIDSDKNRLHSDARPYLREALDDLLAGRTPPEICPEPLGCALELY